MAKHSKTFAASLMLTISAMLLCACSVATQPEPEAIEMESAEVIYVVDGDTLCVQRESIQGPEKVRLIGVNTPEAVASEEYLEAHNLENTQEGVEASDFVKGLVPKGSTVWLQFDEDPEDDYGRLLAYVWLEKPADPMDQQEVSAKMLNGILLAEGYAETMTIQPNTMYAELFARIEL